jgi:hypothetical protein
MRIPKQLSPSSLGLWESDREAFYLKHLAETKPPKTLQMNYMAIGSAFDAYVKSALHEALFGKGADPAFELDALFTSQVDDYNRDESAEAGHYAFECYKLSGAYDDLLHDLEKSEFAPKFEFRLEKTIDGVPLTGFPDCRYIHESGAHVILDWKVNGFYSKYGATPYKYYAMIRDGWLEISAKPSRGCNQPHKSYSAITHKGVKIGSHYMEETCKDWADQLSIYAWMLDVKVGDEDVIFCIDQLASKRREGAFPLLRIANHRARISKAWQNQLVQRLQRCRGAIQSGYIFTDLTREESEERQEVLEMFAKALRQGGSTHIEDWVDEISQSGMKFRTR